MTGQTGWRKAAASTAQGNCVELRLVGDTVEIRDSKDPSGPVLSVDRWVLAGLLISSSRGEFDDLAGPA